MRLGLGLKFNSPFFLFFLLLAPPFPAPLFSFLPFQLPFSLLLSLLSFPLLPALLFYLVSQLPFSLFSPSLFFLFFLLLAPPFPAPLFSLLPLQLLLSLFLSILFSRFLPVPPISHCRTWKLRLLCLRLFRS